jgi:hypothetical protein
MFSFLIIELKMFGIIRCFEHLSEIQQLKELEQFNKI